MANQTVATAESLLVNQSPVKRFLITFKKNWQLHLMTLLPFVYILLYNYLPMFGLQIVFREYRARAGLFGSEWVGLKHFFFFFANNRWTTYVWNTLRISLYSLLAGFPVPIILALMLHVNENKILKKLTQNVSYVPHFISTVVMVGILNRVFDPYTGLIGSFANLLGQSAPDDIRANPDLFDHLYVWSGIWQGMGWSAIMYVSALSSVSPELHEAARIDGASRWKRVLNVDIPAIAPTICILLIMRCGSILSVGYEKIYLMQNGANSAVSEVISTYVYKNGLARNELSFGTAVGLMNSVVNTSMVLLVNWITNKLSDGESGLF